MSHGVSPECPKSVPRVSPECQKGVPDTPGGHSRDTFWTLRSPGPQGPLRHPVGHSPRFRGHSRGTPWESFGPEGPERLLQLAGEFKLQLAQLFLNSWGCPKRPLTLILLEKHRDINGRRIVIQSDGVYTTFCQEEAYFCKSIAIEMGGVPRHFQKYRGQGSM